MVLILLEGRIKNKRSGSDRVSVHTQKIGGSDRPRGVLIALAFSSVNTPIVASVQMVSINQRFKRKNLLMFKGLVACYNFSMCEKA